MSFDGDDVGPMDLPSPSSNLTSRRPTLLANTREDEADTSRASSHVEAHAMDQEDSQNGGTEERDQRELAMNEAEFEEHHNIQGNQLRRNASGYAAPTRASQAKKNEKVEVINRSGSVRYRAHSGQSDWQPGVLQHSVSRSRGARNGSTSSNHTLYPEPTHIEGADDMRGPSPDPNDAQLNRNDATEVPYNWGEMDQENTPMVDGDECLEEDGMKKRMKELIVERDGAMERCNRVDQELYTTKGKVSSLLQRQEELEASIRELETASTKHNKELEDELQSCKTDAESWKRKHDELEEKLEQRNRIELRLSLLEATEAENKRLRAMNTANQDEMAKTQAKLQQTQKDLEEMTEYAERTNSDILDSNKTLDSLRKSIGYVSKVIQNWVQASPNNLEINPSDMDGLIRDCADDDTIGELLVNTQNFLRASMQKQESLEQELEQKSHEVSSIKLAIEEQLQGTGLLSPGLAGPGSALYHDMNGLQKLYEEERQRREAAEEKLRGIPTASEELQPSLEGLKDENNRLRQEIDDAKAQAESYKQDYKQSKLELEKRDEEFQSYISQKEQEIDQYIKDYLDKARDERYWEPANLHKKLEDEERQYTKLKQLFDWTKTADARRQDELAKLQKKCKMQTTLLRNMQQAYHQRQQLPNLPDLEDDDDSDRGFDSDASSSSSLSQSSSRPASPSAAQPEPARLSSRRRRVPRYQHAEAVSTRREKVEAFRADLHAKSEAELLDSIFEPVYVETMRPVGKKDRCPADDIMESVREMSLEDMYPRGKKEWTELRKKSVWERWQGGRYVDALPNWEKDILRQRGVLGP